MPNIKQIVESCNRNVNTFEQSIVDSIKEIECQNELLTSNLTVEDLKAEKAQRMHAILRPPDDFRQIPVCPTFDEMHDNYEPFLRCNLIKGKYSDVDHYLDVQFRLLREHFVRPLRKGIAEYIRAKKDGHPLHKLQDIRLYASFDVSKLRYVEWKVFQNI